MQLCIQNPASVQLFFHNCKQNKKSLCADAEDAETANVFWLWAYYSYGAPQATNTKVKHRTHQILSHQTDLAA